jgi:hypothetical protein
MRRSALIALIAVVWGAASLGIPALGKAIAIAWWTAERLTDSPLTAVSCAPSTLCVAGDQGNVYAGQPTQ